MKRSPMKPSTPKLRLCKGCRERKPPFRPGAQVCSISCSETYAKLLAEKKQRAETKRHASELKAQLEAAKPLKWHLKLCEKAVNAYARERDYFEPCCSCGLPPHSDVKWNASHLKSVGSNSTLRFHLWNIQKSCYRCNWELSGNIGEYKRRYALKFGPERLAWIESQNGIRKFTVAYVDRLAAIMRKKTWRAEKRRLSLQSIDS